MSDYEALVTLTGGVRETPVGRKWSLDSHIRARATADVYHRSGDPAILVSGGIPGGRLASLIADEMVRKYGSPEDSVVVEEDSLHTRQSAENAKRVLGEGALEDIALISSRDHYRAPREFERMGIDVDFLPAEDVLREEDSRLAHFAREYERMRVESGARGKQRFFHDICRVGLAPVAYWFREKALAGNEPFSTVMEKYL